MWIVILLGLAGAALELLAKGAFISDDLRSNSGLLAVIGLALCVWYLISFLMGKVSLNARNISLLLLGFFLNGAVFFLMKDGLFIFILFPFIVIFVVILRLIFNFAHYISDQFIKSKNR